MQRASSAGSRYYDALIVGAGPAGLNAALLLGRARRSVLVFDDGAPRNAVAAQMHGFISRDGLSPRIFLQRARRELGRYPSVELVRHGVVDVANRDGRFVATTADGQEYDGRRILVATGMRDDLPDVEGMDAFWGRSVFVCPYCDGWELRDRRIVVYGRLRRSIDLAQELYQWTRSLTVCADRNENLAAPERRWLESTGIAVKTAPLQALLGRHGNLHAVELRGGERIPCDAVFLSAALQQRSDIPARLGCRFEKSAIAVDAEGRTSIPGCYAAGDAVTDHHQAILAAASGVRAAIALNADLSEEAVAALAAG